MFLSPPTFNYRRDTLARLDYCDIYGECRYFIRCAELGNRPQIVTYCGTRVGDLSDDVNAEQP